MSVHQNLTVETETLPLLFIKSYVPFDRENEIGYWMTVTFQFYSTFLYGQYICAIDVILCGFMIQVKAQLLILKNYVDLFLTKCEEKFVSKNFLFFVEFYVFL